MDRIRQLLAILLVLVCGVCVLVWAGWFNPDIDFLGLSRYARQFPMGPDTGPLAVAFGALFLAWIIFPGGSGGTVHHHHH
jgi:hypothetical protein